MVSSKQVIVPPPVSYFRGNEFDIGAFATYVTWSCGPGEAAAHGRGADVLTSPPSARP